MNKKIFFMVIMCIIAQTTFAQNYSLELEQKAKEGIPQAQRDLGFAYISGNNINKNTRQGLYWIKKSAEQGYAPACVDLGYCYENGIGVEKDSSRSFEWYMKAAEKNDHEGEFYVGVGFENGIGVGKDLKKAAVWYEKAAVGGNKTAQFNLGCLYANGLESGPNYKKAVYWYTKSADQGFDWAQINLANCYYSGDGVEVNIEKAKQLMKKAADQENKVAYYNLGSYYKNENNRKGYELSIEYYKKAATLGHAKSAWNLPISQLKLAETYIEDNNWDIIFDLMKQAAENKDNSPVGAMRGLAYLYESYDKIKDIEKSNYWKKRAQEEKDKNGEKSMQYK